IHEPYEPLQSVTEPRPGSVEDGDPLPLELRRPDRRRLVYYNRLGSGRGLYCAECWSDVACPRCGSSRIHYAPSATRYTCPDCGLSERDLRCPRCNLITLVSVLPGLESVSRRPGDLILHGPASPSHTQDSYASIFGTSQLLDPVAGFWPELIVYVHAEGRVGLMADWPGAIDMALRLRALYNNPQLGELHIVSARLREQLGSSTDAQQVGAQYESELGLRELAGLPPYGTLYHLRAVSAKSSALGEARLAIGEYLQAQPDTRLLRLGTSFRQGGAYRLAAWLVNPSITLEKMQNLRWQLQRMDATLTIQALRGPWV
nr:hypothetical protein [bacterium]